MERIIDTIRIEQVFIMSSFHRGLFACGIIFLAFTADDDSKICLCGLEWASYRAAEQESKGLEAGLGVFLRWLDGASLEGL